MIVLWASIISVLYGFLIYPMIELEAYWFSLRTKKDKDDEEKV